MAGDNRTHASVRQTASESDESIFQRGYAAGLNDASLKDVPPRLFGGIERSGSGNACNTQAQAGRPMSQEERIAELFKYHAPREDQLPKYDAIRTAAKHFAEILLKNTTYGKDQEAALSKLRVAVMLANASVALDGLS
jgi:hypothetical protein